MDEKTWGTTDLYTAAALLTCGHKLLATEEKGEHGRATKTIFKFEDAEVATDLMDYTNGDLELNARGLFDNWRYLKNLVHNTSM